MQNLTYFQHLKKALEQEQAEEQAQYTSRLRETPLDTRVKQGITWYPLDIVKTRFVMGNRQELELKPTKPLPMPEFSNGQPLRLFQLDTNESLTGILTHKKTDSLCFLPYQEEIPESFSQGVLALETYFDQSSYREMFYALEQVMGADKDEHLGKLRDLSLGEKPSKPDPSLPFEQIEHLNPAQNATVKTVMQCPDLGWIHGPPGTGKTTTLTRVIAALLTHENQVLVCAPSNTAVDLLTLKCDQLGLKVLRLGHPARMSKDLQRLSLDTGILEHPNYQVIQNMRSEAFQTRQKALKYKRNFDSEAYAQRKADLRSANTLLKEARHLEKQLIQFLLDEAQVITATLVGASHRILKGRQFQTVLIDEAAQALEPACWIPVLKAQRVILAGDHCQLPPTIKSPKAQKLSETLFERVVHTQPQNGGMLEIQYRMNQAIMAFSNQHFYQGHLKADDSVAQHQLASDIGPLTWIDTAGCGYEEARNPDTLSYANPQEGELLIKYLNLLLPQVETPISIGIIAPYRAQVEWFEAQNLPELFPQHQISVGSVDGFQGQERDLICISMVRSNEQGEVGFLKDTRRMNVAMTRARKKLLMVGDSATLGQHPFYQSLLDHLMVQESAYESAWEYMSWET